MKGEFSLGDFEQTLVRVIGNDHPETLGQAVKLACSRLSDCGEDKAVVDCVLRLESQGKILLEKPVSVVPSSLMGFFLSGFALWFWLVFVSAVATTVMVFVVPESMFPLVYVRYVFGSVFVLFLPGFSLIRALFASKELDGVER